MESMLGLQRIATSDADRAGIVARQLDARETVACAFGPGLTLYSALLRGV